jgi:hypothetical protein
MEAIAVGGSAAQGMCTALLACSFPGRKRFMIGVSQASYYFGATAGPFVMGIFLPLGRARRGGEPA